MLSPRGPRTAGSHGISAPCPTNAPTRRTPTEMVDILNAFILLLAVGAAWLGVSAVVRKRIVRRHKDAPQNGNHAA